MKNTVGDLECLEPVEFEGFTIKLWVQRSGDAWLGTAVWENRQALTDRGFFEAREVTRQAAIDAVCEDAKSDIRAVIKSVG